MRGHPASLETGRLGQRTAVRWESRTGIRTRRLKLNVKRIASMQAPGDLNIRMPFPDQYQAYTADAEARAVPIRTYSTELLQYSAATPSELAEVAPETGLVSPSYLFPMTYRCNVP